MARVAIALGSNLGDRRGYLDAALHLLRRTIPDLRCSPFVETLPLGAQDQPLFLNAAAVGTWTGSPLELLTRLQAVETELGRTRPFQWAPRTIDLDLILYDDHCLTSAELTVPHPRFRDRGFVLDPLSRVAHGWRDPVTGKTIHELRLALPGHATTRIALCQFLAGRDHEANVERGVAAVRTAAAGGARLVCFPELAFTPFFPSERAVAGRPLDLAHSVPGPLTDTFCTLAAELGIVVILNLYEQEGERTYDSSPVIDADGALLGVTRMVHVAHMPGCWEQDYYTPGDRGMPVYETAAGRVGVAICYDRHYPEIMRHLGLQRADLVVVPQAGTVGEWPEGLFEAELRVAAFQNGYFAALANRVGTEPGAVFAGQSFACDGDGRILARAGSSEETLLFVDLDYNTLPTCHARRLFFRDRRHDVVDRWSSSAD